MKDMIKAFLKELYFTMINAFPWGLKNRASILMYHSVGGNSAFFTVPAKDFETQMEYLAGSGREVVALSELVRRMRIGQSISNCVAITFDDGYEDNYTVAFPILERLGLPFTVFVATDYIGKSMTNSESITLPMMDEDEFKKISASQLCELMPHTASHKPLTAYTGADLSWQNDIVQSRKRLIADYGSTGALFAYPQGKYMPAAVEYLRHNGYSAAVTVEEGLVALGDDLFALKRNSIDSTTSIEQFKGKISYPIEWYARMKRS